jgi:hypothetical protein
LFKKFQKLNRAKQCLSLHELQEEMGKQTFQEHFFEVMSEVTGLPSLQDIQFRVALFLHQYVMVVEAT